MEDRQVIGNRPLRVAMLARVVFPLHGFGGIERHVFHLVTHLARLDVAVTLYVQDEARGLKLEASDAEHATSLKSLAAHLKYLRYDYTTPLLRPNSILGRQINYPWYSWQLGLAAAAGARRGDYDVVHAQGLCAFGYAWIRRRDPLLRRLPFIANPHGLEEYRTPDWRKRLAYAPFRALYSYGNQCADRVIATDACTQDDLPRYLAVDPARVVVIPSAIDVAECLAYLNDATRVKLQTRLALAESDLTLLSVGRLERNKGFHVMLEALARLRQRLPPRWRWLLVGQGTERARLEEQARALGIADHVGFVGRLDDAELHNLYEDVDLVVHPTLYEGSSLVTLEGMIHRRPMVASAAGGIPDKVFDGRNGYLVRPGDSADLADKLSLALDQRARWPEWGEESVRIVRSTFDWPVVARRTRDTYEQMIATGLPA
ncbi:MAG TPA: glycosyltransferase family 4 protein [Roseiflexaceae bacterium]|nr:glycosyltransferase family 4 protein [Roseiflexaceae bacterium]